MDGHQMARPDLAPIAMLVWKLRISQQYSVSIIKGFLKCFPLVFFCSYEIMQSCWMLDQDERPNFSQLRKSLGLLIANTLETGGYLCVNDSSDDHGNTEIPETST